MSKFRWSKFKLAIAAAAIVFAAPSAVRATDYISADFIVRDPIIGAGGTYSSSASFQNYGQIVQTDIGLENSPSFIDCNGFLYYEGATSPALTAAARSTGSVALDWSAADGVCGNVVTGYRVGVATTAGGPYVFRDVGAVLAFTDTGLAAGTRYYFVVRAYSGTTVMSVSNETNVTMPSGGGGGGGVTLAPVNPPPVVVPPVVVPPVVVPPVVVPPVVVPPVNPPPTVSGPACAASDCNRIAYDLYLINPDGTERHTGSAYVKVNAVSAAVTRHFFEDKGNDMDFNDVVVDVDKTDCRRLKLTETGLSAAWHHQVRLKIFFDAQEKRDSLIWPDTQAALGQSVVLDAGSADICGGQSNLAASGLAVGDLIKGVDSTVFYVGRDGERHIFPNPRIYKTWYRDFLGVKQVTPEKLDALPLGANVLYRPGAKLVKLVSDAKVYAMAAGNILRWIMDGRVAAELFGANWRKLVDDISVALFTDYSVGEPIKMETDYSRAAEMAKTPTVDQNLGLADRPTAGVAPPAGTEPDCTSSARFTGFLTSGSTGLLVKPLQLLLRCLGYLPADIAASGVYGDHTAQAVRGFQRANGLTPTGSVGPATRQLLNNHYRPTVQP